MKKILAGVCLAAGVWIGTAVIAAEDISIRGVVQVNVEPVRHVKHDQPEPCVGARQLLCLAICQHYHIIPRQIIGITTDRR